MEKEVLEDRVTFKEKVIRWTNNCIWSGLVVGPIVSYPVYTKLLSSEKVYTPAHEKTVLTVLGSFVISGLVIGSIYYFLKLKKSQYSRQRSF